MGDTLARVMVAQLSKRTGPFAYNTDIGLRRWRAALSKLKAGAIQFVNVSVLGDSITEGYGATTPRTGGYVGRIRSGLAAKYGDVGLGMVPTYYVRDTPLWTFVGTWTDMNNNFGCTSLSKFSQGLNDTATLQFNGTGAGIVMSRGTKAGTFSVTIDGGAPQPFNGNNATSINAYIYEITGLVNGAHTLVITNTDPSAGAASGQVFLTGAYEIKGTAGVRVNMVGRYATQAGSSSPVVAMAAEIDVWSPALTVIAFTANDYNSGTSLSSYTTSLQEMVTQGLKYGDVLLLSTGIRTETAGVIAPQSAYADIVRQLALQNNVAYIDLFNRWSGDANYAKNTLGFLSDTVHPNDYGHQDIATAVLNVLLEDR